MFPSSEENNPPVTEGTVKKRSNLSQWEAHKRNPVQHAIKKNPGTLRKAWKGKGALGKGKKRF